MTDCKVKNKLIRLLRDCRKRPDLFNELILKRAPYWSRQMDLCRSVVEYRTTVAYSGNMVGKDYWVAGIVRGRGSLGSRGLRLRRDRLAGLRASGLHRQ